MRVIASSSNSATDALDGAATYEHLSSNAQTSNDNAYNDLQNSPTPVAGAVGGADTGNIYMYHKPSARYESLPDDQ